MKSKFPAVYFSLLAERKTKIHSYHYDTTLFPPPNAQNSTSLSLSHIHTHSFHFSHTHTHTPHSIKTSCACVYVLCGKMKESLNQQPRAVFVCEEERERTNLVIHFFFPENWLRRPPPEGCRKYMFVLVRACVREWLLFLESKCYG